MNQVRLAGRRLTATLKFMRKPGSLPPRKPWGVWFSSALSTLLPPHSHSCPELNLVMSGSMTYRVTSTGCELEACAGQLIVVPARVRHELIRSSEDLALWVVELNDAPRLTLFDLPVVLTPSLSWKKEFVASARRLWLRPSAEQVPRLEMTLWALLASFRENLGPPPLSPPHPAVMRARQVCETFVDEELDIGSLARQTGLSASRLAHVFVEHVGITPLQYRNFTRVQHFIRSYDGDERNLLRAALRAGFGSYAQFHRVFRQVCGESPGAHFRWLSDSGQVDAKRTLGATVAPLSAPA